jgi:hypothetical protein
VVGLRGSNCMGWGFKTLKLFYFTYQIFGWVLPHSLLFYFFSFPLFGGLLLLPAFPFPQAILKSKARVSE